jgi:hypothetical protein
MIPDLGKTYLLGFYLGIGDFLSAVPVINQLLKQGNRVVVAASEPNLELSELLEFPAGKPEFISFAAFSVLSSVRHLPFVSELRQLNPDFAFVSPHASREVSSWKMPMLLYLLRKTVWKSTTVVGADDERLSVLFDLRVKIDRSLRLVEREYSLHTNFGSIESGIDPDRGVFRASPDRADRIHRRALVLHPGASRCTKMWPVEYYLELVKNFANIMPVKFVGIASELDPIRETLTDTSGVEFVCGKITEAVRTLSEAAVVLTMDSGFSHVAALLGVRHLALFGSTDPLLYAPKSDHTEVVFENKLPCQPCNAHVCPYPGIPCMRAITPEIVANRLRAALSTTCLVSGTSDV